MRRACGKKIGVVALSQFSSGAHGEVYGALRKLEKQGAQAFVFDLRGNGGGLVDEAQLIASAFLPDGRIVTTRGRNVPEKTLDATGDPVIGKDTEVAVLVDRGTASASEIVAGALQDRDRATIVGTRTFGKGVFQEVIELSNGGALDITVGQYFTPKGRNLGGRGVSAGTGLKPDVAARDDPKTARTRRCARRCAPPAAARPSPPGEPRRAPRRGSRTAARGATGRSRRPSVAAGRDDERDPNAPFVLLLEGRARFLVGEPFFERGRRFTVGRSPREARPGRLALVRPGGGGRVDVLRVLGEPHVARDVIEALMLDRGLRRRSPPGSSARRARPSSIPRRPRCGATCATCRRSRSTRRPRGTSTTRSPPRTCDGGRIRVWVHIADVSAYVRPGDAVDREAYRRATSVYVPGAVEPMLPRRCRTTRARSCPARTGSPSRPSWSSTGAETVKATFHRSLIRSDARLDYDRVDRIFAGEEHAQEPWAGPLAAARAVAAALEDARRAAGHALAIESVEPEFDFDRGGHVTDAATTAQTESHRLIEHLMIAANEAVARLLAERGVPALYRVHERPEPVARRPPRWSSSPRSTCRRRRRRRERMTSSRRRTSSREASAPRRRARAPDRPRARGR